jgi:hypothetical protein
MSAAIIEHCPICGAPLEVEREPQFGTVTSTATTSTVSFAPAESGAIGLSPFGPPLRHLRCPNCQYVRPYVPTGD